MNKKVIKGIISVIASLAVIAGVYYFKLPPINIHSEAFWIFLAFSALAISLPLAIVLSGEPFWVPVYDKKKPSKNKSINIKFSKATKVIIAVTVAVPAAVLILGGLFSSEFFT